MSEALPMDAIGARYDARREEILDAIRSGKVSTSMSGIEYYPKAWADLDMAIAGDAFIKTAWLTPRQ